MKRILRNALFATFTLLASIASAQTILTPAGPGTTDYILCANAVAASAPADTNEDFLGTCSIPAGAMGANGVLRVTANFTVTNSANNKTLRVRFSGTSGTAVGSAVVTTVASSLMQVSVWNRASQSSQYAMMEMDAGSSVSAASTTSSVDTTGNTLITVSCQKASSGETCTLESLLVELMPRT